MPLDVIIMDFNGVIVDDESIHFNYIRDIVADFGIELNRRLYDEKYVAMSDRDAFAAILSDFGRQPTPERIAALCERKRTLYLEEAIREVRLFPGVREFIEGAAMAYRLAVASGARREEIEAILDVHGLKGAFEVIVSADEVTRGKPAPDIYRKVLDELEGVTPDRCLVIEDTPGGIRAAKAAKLPVVAVTNTFPPDALKEADLILMEGLVNFPWVQVKLLLDERGR